MISVDNLKNTALRDPLSESTSRAYTSDIRIFREWCAAHGLAWIPASPRTVARFLAAQARDGLKFSTINRRMAAISQIHQDRGFESPKNQTVRRTIQSIARTYGTDQRRKDAVDLSALSRMLRHASDGLIGKRNRAIVLLGFAAALHRGEIAALQVDDLEIRADYLRLRLARGFVDIPRLRKTKYCAVRAVLEWLSSSGIDAGPLFRSFSASGRLTDHPIDGRDVANLIKRLASRSGLRGDFSGHSLRCGHVTAAVEAGATVEVISVTTRHKSVASVLRNVRPSGPMRNSSLSAIFST